MAGTQTQFQTFLNEELAKTKGIYYPVKANILQQALIRKARLSKLHPNPDDEFCDPKIGPNYSIISRYESDYRRNGDNISSGLFVGEISEPLMVEKTRPNGYRILNGHHRWAGAMRAGFNPIGIRIVNLTTEADVHKMLKKTDRTRRVSMDLDEVIFVSDGGKPMEENLSFPFNRIYRERIRLGIPALLEFLDRKGFDVWVYSSRYYSVEYLQNLFRHYHCRVTGIITGTARKSSAKVIRSMGMLVDNKYKCTVHVDNESVICTFRDEKEFEETMLSGSEQTWSAEVMDAIGALKAHE